MSDDDKEFHDKLHGLEMGLELTGNLADQWKQRAEAAETQLGELLAIIHRDGGHYLGEHGQKKAVDDAHQVWAQLQARVGELEGALEFISEAHDAGRHDGQPEPCPAHDADTMFAVARQAFADEAG